MWQVPLPANKAQMWPQGKCTQQVGRRRQSQGKRRTEPPATWRTPGSTQCWSRQMSAWPRTRCSSWFFSSSCASIWHNCSSMLPCLSSACRQEQCISLTNSDVTLGTACCKLTKAEAESTPCSVQRFHNGWKHFLTSTNTSWVAACVSGRQLTLTRVALGAAGVW